MEADKRGCLSVHGPPDYARQERGPGNTMVKRMDTAYLRAHSMTSAACGLMVSTHKCAELISE